MCVEGRPRNRHNTRTECILFTEEWPNTMLDNEENRVYLHEMLGKGVLEEGADWGRIVFQLLLGLQMIFESVELLPGNLGHGWCVTIIPPRKQFVKGGQL
jgi:hypothetical protein